jgi:hypothetical protein
VAIECGEPDDTVDGRYEGSIRLTGVVAGGQRKGVG